MQVNLCQYNIFAHRLNECPTEGEMHCKQGPQQEEGDWEGVIAEEERVGD